MCQVSITVITKEATHGGGASAAAAVCRRTRWLSGFCVPFVVQRQQVMIGLRSTIFCRDLVVFISTLLSTCH